MSITVMITEDGINSSMSIESLDSIINKTNGGILSSTNTNKMACRTMGA